MHVATWEITRFADRGRSAQSWSAKRQVKSAAADQSRLGQSIGRLEQCRSVCVAAD